MKSFVTYSACIILTALLFAGCQKNEKKDQSLQPAAAVVDFNYTADAANSKNIKFTNTNVGTGSIYQWQWGDSTYSSGSAPAHIYAAAGNYTVKLTVTNGSGIQTQSKDIKVSAVDFLLTTNDATDALKITVENKSVNCTNYKWEWGDGTETLAENPGSHVFAASGVFTVRLSGKVANSTINTTKEITVFVAAKAQLAGAVSAKWKYHPTQGLSFFGSYSNQTDCELNTEFIFFANNNYQCDNKGSEIVFPSCTAKPARPQTTWSLTRVSLTRFKLNIGTAAASFFGDPVTGPDYTLINLTANLLEIDKVNFGFTDEVKYKMVKVP